VAAGPLTIEGSILGTVSYMSPEQAEGKTVDPRSDIFSFGVVVYEMVTGRRAFAGDTTLSTLSSILRDDVRPVSETHAHVPPLLEHIVRKCLAKNPAARWQSMQEVRAALVALKHDSDFGARAPLPVKRRSRLPIVLAAAGAVLLAAVGGWWTVSQRRPAQLVAMTAPAPSSAPPVPAPVPATSTDGSVLTNDGIVAMVRAKVAPSIILEQIRFSQTRFDLSTQEIIRLTEAGVPPQILETMRDPKRQAVTASKPATGKPVSNTPANTPASAPMAIAPAANTPAAATPPANSPAADRPAIDKPATQPVTQSITVPDGLPFSIRLTEDIPSDAEPGRPLRFTAVRDFRIGEATVVAANAVVTGEIVDGAKRKLLGGAKVTFRLKDAAAVDGGKLSVRAMPSRRGSDARRPVEGTSVGKHPKEIAAPAGTEYVAYSEGDQTVTIRK
jgi:serine/threonine-protein kinase